MKTLKQALSICLAIVIISLAASEALACSCRQKSSVCNAFGDAAAVFVGKVVEGNSVERMSDMVKAGTKDLMFTFKVSRAFLGAQMDQTVKVHTGFGFGDCGFPFEKGEEYIVYAYQSGDTKVLSTGICTRTTHISRAQDDIDGLEGLSKSKGASVTGTITRYERSSLLGEPRLPLGGITVELLRMGDRKNFFARTNATGEFAFAGLKGGKYRVIPPVEKGWEVDDYETEEFVLNEHGCATNDISIENDSEINVKVVDPQGRPVPSIWVELIPTTVEWSDRSSVDEFTVTDPQGQATFYDKPPGRYTISVNYFNTPDQEAPYPPVFAPDVEDRSRARVFEIRPGTKLQETVVIRIPRVLESVSIKGTVVGSDGKPVKGAQVNLVDEKAPDICTNGCAETNEKGEFVVTGYRGRKYLIEALLRNEAGDPADSGATTLFELRTNPLPIRIVLKPSK